jgi:hypothetical protein
MIKRQNSEKIFLQPIDQHYDNQNPKDELKFYEDYDKMIDCLNISTDSETISRKDSFDDMSFYRLEEALKNDWRDNVESLRINQIHFFKNLFFQKIMMFRHQLENGLRARTYSCPNKNVIPDLQYIHPFGRKISETSNGIFNNVEDGVEL